MIVIKRSWMKEACMFDSEYAAEFTFYRLWAKGNTK